MRLVFDLEANGLYNTADTIWCICAKDIDTGEKYEWNINQKSKTSFLKLFQTTFELIGHNIINYDLPLLKKLWDWEPNKNVKITDTLVMSYLGNPDRPKPPGLTGKSGSHGLEAWGHRTGTFKPSHEEWNVFSPAMLRRCREDVEINVLTYSLLRQELTPIENWQDALDLEHEISRLITKQEHHGILFDKEKAEEYIQWLTNKIDEIDKKIIPKLPKEIEMIGSVPINNPFLKTGDYRKQTQDYINEAYNSEKYCSFIGGPFTRIKFNEFNVGSTEKIKSYLLENGWQPESWNFSKTTGERTSPKLEGKFRGVTGEIPRAIKERITWRHRRSQIEGWLENLRKDSRLSAGAFPNATNTARMKHHTVVNIPKANIDKNTHELIWDTDKQTDIFGTQMRSLFIAPEGFKLVGHDASGLELRMLAHYLNSKTFTEHLLHGDIHEYNRGAAGLPDRNAAKTFIYAFLYGAGDKKIGSIIGGNEGDGRELKQKFMDSLPELRKLIERVQRASGKGWLKGLDGRVIHMRRHEDGRVRRNAALNTLLQSSGSIVMKKSCCILWNDVRENNITAYKVLDMHDEGQAEVLIKDVNQYCDLAVNSIVKSGEHFNLNIPLAAEAKVGNNMAETH